MKIFKKRKNPKNKIFIDKNENRILKLFQIILKKIYLVEIKIIIIVIN